MSYIDAPTWQERYQGIQNLKTQNYRMMPIPLSATLKQSVWLTLGSTVTYSIIYLLIPPHVLPQLFNRDFFILPFTLGWVNSVIEFYWWSGNFFFIANLLSLGGSLLLICLSAGLALPILEPFHYMVVADAVPAGLSIITLLLSIAIIAVAVLANFVAWLCISAFVLIVLLGFISSL